MKEFKPGERIAFYHSGKRYTGKIESTIGSDPIARVFHDEGRGGYYWVHPKQARRLVKKKKQLQFDGYIVSEKLCPYSSLDAARETKNTFDASVQGDVYKIYAIKEITSSLKDSE